MISPVQARTLTAALLIAATLGWTASAVSQATVSRSAASPGLAEITDRSGAPIAGAQILDSSGVTLASSDASGHVSNPCASACTITVQARGFAPRTLLWQPGSAIVLEVASAVESVTVTAYRTPLGDLESPVSTRVLAMQDLQQSAPITLEGQLRQIPGVETFRRSSSLVANPSSQGLSLRGLGSTSASRTLVTEDDVPLNDAFAGWIHWQELPELSIRSVEVVRGGASDLYGSSAIGGVVNVLQQRPTDKLVQLKSSYGSEETYQSSLLLEGRSGRWGAIASGGVLGTDGFITVAPSARGVVDTASNVHAQNGVVLLDHQTDHNSGPLRIFFRTSVLNEARNNGTLVQNNGTRLWRYATGGDWHGPDSSQHAGTLTFRAYGSAQHYRQTFSTIAAGRVSETLNRFARTPDDELGAVAHYSQPVAPGLLFLIGADTHDVRALDEETTFKAGVTGHINLTDRQRQTGAYAELLYDRQAWTVSGSGRLDWFSNFDATRLLPAAAPLPDFSEHVFDPRLGLSRKVGQHLALSAQGFRAYRAPTPNELYRSTQVGSLLTLPNNNLRSERATGWETGIAMQQHWGTVRTSYFWTRVNRPITALTTNPSSNPIQLTRENLGQIESRGVSFDSELQPARWMTVQGGYQYTNATVTKAVAPSAQFPLQTVFPGYWIPQVAHNMGTLQLRAYRPSIGTLSIESRISGHQFDDDANTYLLHSYFKLDAYGSHVFARRYELFASGENLLDRAIEVGRTPTLTLANPRTARIGINLKLTPR